MNRFILRLYLDRVRDIPLGGVLAPFVDWRKSVTVDSIKKYKHSSRKEAIKSIFKPSFWLSSETVGALMVFSIVAIGINQATYQWYTPEASSSALLVPGPVTVQCSDDGHRLTVNWVQRAGGISPSGYRVRETLSSRNIRSADQQLTQTVSREATSVTFDASPGSTYEFEVAAYLTNKETKETLYTLDKAQEGTTTCP